MNQKSGKSKTVVVFYSRTGNTKRIGNDIAKELNADVDEIKTLKNYKGVWGYLRAGFQATFGWSPRINTEKNPMDYDIVIIGTPVWAGLSSPVRAYLAKNKFKKVAFFCTLGGRGFKRAFRHMETLAGKPVSVLFVYEKELKDNSYKEKLKEFCEKLKK